MADANAEIHRRINELIDEEHRLRGGQAPDLDDTGRRRRLAELEVQLDQAWDLLRQRQARREWDQDPERAQERPTRVVENYEN
jgi:GntR family transcriptional regulator/MocR family aminotransferase